MAKSIVLLSGGLDSLVSLAIAVKSSSEVLAITFNYGQKSFNSELKASKDIVEYYSVEHVVVDLPWLNLISTSSLNTDENVPSLDIESLVDFPTVSSASMSVWVPNRNALFANIAGSYAEAKGFDSIYIGANSEEAQTFKDNTISFVNAVNSLFEQSMNSTVNFVAPLINLSKDEIVKMGLDLGVPFELLHSCYLSNNIHCGCCESCLRLKRALLNNNQYDLVKKIFRG